MAKPWSTQNWLVPPELIEVLSSRAKTTGVIGPDEKQKQKQKHVESKKTNCNKTKKIDLKKSNDESL